MVDAEGEFVEYVSARLPSLHRTAFLMCGDAHLADDVVQQTITALYVNWLAERDSLLAALARLPRGQRTVLVLRFLCDLSLADTAAAMGCSEGNVKAQTARALAAVRQVLDVTEMSVRSPR
ncbi:sigma factor-like helix-turn-helix DNA-binding protein [Micromonospora sp. NPDC051227]|uniref:sigma factor-like helix-turn-helix DNA-binding protein n=1 Tax=Micromonospora sp. NPDC051227 TaxID=3364285 RepID=UPI0037BDC55D